MSEFLYGQNVVVIGAAFAAVLLASYELAFRVGLRLGRADRERATPATVQATQGGLLGLIGLLLGFSFAMAAARFEARKAGVLAEANAIGTAYLRAQMLRPPHREQISSMLREYTDARIDAYAHVLTNAEFREVNDRFAEQLDRLWTVTLAVAEADDRGPIVSLCVSSINAVIDEHSERIASLQNHVPEPILFLLFIICIAGIGFIGYGAGLAGRRHWLPACAFSLILVLVVLIILDLDRPRRGMIKIDQSSLLELRESMRSAPGGA